MSNVSRSIASSATFWVCVVFCLRCSGIFVFGRKIARLALLTIEFVRAVGHQLITPLPRQPSGQRQSVPCRFGAPWPISELGTGFSGPNNRKSRLPVFTPVPPCFDILHQQRSRAGIWESPVVSCSTFMTS